MRVALITLLTAASVGSLEAQDTTGVFQDSASVETPRLYRDPHRARVLGTILPGAGHIYAGEYLRGYATWVGTIAGIGTGPLVYTLDRCAFAFLNGSRCDPGPKWPSRVLGVFMVGSGIWTWISSARDAPRAAERANERHQSRKFKLTPLLSPSALDLRLRTGIEIHW
jgi:hypothetical protein